MKYLVKIDRLSAWVLFICMILYFVSGYGMLKGIINPALAVKIHLNYLTYIAAVAFVIHTSYAISLAFKRWNIWNIFTKILLLLFYIVLVISLIWVDHFYVKKIPAPNTQNLTNISGTRTTLNMQEIAKHNSASNCWMVINNKVYNLTSFINYHSGGAGNILPYCGKDGTNAFNTKDGQGSHRSGDINIMSNYYIGDLTQKITFN